MAEHKVINILHALIQAMRRGEITAEQAHKAWREEAIKRGQERWVEEPKGRKGE